MVSVKQSFKRWIRHMLKGYRVPFVVLDGLEKSSGQKVVLVISAGGPELVYLSELVFGNHYTERCARSVWIWNLRRNALKNGADLLVCFSRKGVIPACLERSGNFRIPVWIYGDIDFSTVEKLKASSKNIKRDLGRVRRYGLSYQVTGSVQQFDRFYHSMHLPYARKAHGKAAYLINYNEFASKLDNSELLWIKKDDELVAGQLLVYEKGLPCLWMLGMKDGSLDYMKMGALTACYIFSMQYLREKGFDRMRAGSSKAFLNDGVLQYKRKWGMKIVGAKESLFVLDVMQSGDGVKSFLANNPFCQLSDGKLVAEVFSPEDEDLSEERLLEINKLFYLSGVSYLNIHRFGAAESRDVEIPSGLSDCITVLDAESTLFGQAD
jgi:hypothetical protein